MPRAISFQDISRLLICLASANVNLIQVYIWCFKISKTLQQGGVPPKAYEIGLPRFAGRVVDVHSFFLTCHQCLKYSQKLLENCQTDSAPGLT